MRGRQPSASFDEIFESSHAPEKSWKYYAVRVGAVAVTGISLLVFHDDISGFIDEKLDQIEEWSPIREIPGL